MKTSEKIIARIYESNTKLPDSFRVGFKANDNISKFIHEGEKEELLKEVEAGLESVLRSLVIDVENDHNTKKTAHRMAKMFINETFSGRYNNAPPITTFPNIQHYDEMYVVGPITVRSTCSHHFQNIRGTCFIGVYPGTNVLGLSKFNRIVDWIASRPQIQEEMTHMIADEVEKLVYGATTINHGIDESGSNYVTRDSGIAVMVEAEHFCVTHRGVREHDSGMTTTVLRGKFKEKPNLKSEFIDVVKMMKDKK